MTEETTERREFLKTASVALGGAALAGVVSIEASSAQPLSGKFPRGTNLTVVLEQNIPLEKLNIVLLDIGRLVGCVKCGLNGIDLRLTTVQPQPFDFKSPGALGAQASFFK